LNILIRVDQRRAKLLGLDAPTEHAVLTIDRLDAEICRLAAALGDTGSRILDESGDRPAGSEPATGSTARFRGLAESTLIRLTCTFRSAYRPDMSTSLPEDKARELQAIAVDLR